MCKNTTDFIIFFIIKSPNISEEFRGSSNAAGSAPAIVEYAQHSFSTAFSSMQSHTNQRSCYPSCCAVRVVC